MSVNDYIKKDIKKILTKILSGFAAIHHCPNVER
jgi:hypothetical protein